MRAAPPSSTWMGRARGLADEVPERDVDDAGDLDGRGVWPLVRGLDETLPVPSGLERVRADEQRLDR